MILRSERLVMRPLVEDDVEALAELHGFPEVVIHLEQSGDLDAGTRVARAVAEWRERGFGLMAITEPVTGRFLGRCGLQSVAGHSDVESGLGPSPGGLGRGYAAEAAQACLRWGLDDLALPRVVSFVHPQNRRAARVASAIGMIRVGVTDLRGIKVDVYRADREPPAG